MRSTPDTAAPPADHAPRADHPPAPAPGAPALASLPTGGIGWQVLLLAAPMLGEQVGTFLVGFTDTFLAGRVSKEAVAAVGVGTYLGWFVSLAFTMVSVGSGALIARCFGSGDLHTARRGLKQSLLIATVLGALTSAFVFAAAPAFASAVTQTPEAHRLLVLYARIDSIGYTLFGIQLALGGAIRAAGDTRTPMLVMILINVVNAAVSAALVFGWLGLPQMGVAGVAIGTVVARFLGGVAMIALLTRGLRGLNLRGSLRPDSQIIRRILRIGLPAAGDTGVMGVAQIVFLVIVAHSAAGDLGTVNLAAHTIAMRMEAISYLPAVAWMTAASTLVGQYLGANRPDLASRSGHTAALQGAVLTTGVGVCFYLFSMPIYALMTQDPQVQQVGGTAFRYIAFVQPLLCMAIVYIGALRGAGDTKATLVFSLIGGLGLRIPVALLGVFVFNGGLIGAWCGMWADNIAKFALGGGRFLQGGWKDVRV